MAVALVDSIHTQGNSGRGLSGVSPTCVQQWYDSNPPPVSSMDRRRLSLHWTTVDNIKILTTDWSGGTLQWRRFCGLKT